MKKWFFKIYAWGTGKVFHEFWVFKKGTSVMHLREKREMPGYTYIGKHYELTNK